MGNTFILCSENAIGTTPLDLLDNAYLDGRTDLRPQLRVPTISPPSWIATPRVSMFTPQNKYKMADCDAVRKSWIVREAVSLRPGKQKVRQSVRCESG
jgi:hypothetical protein